ncbi:MAG: L-xylulose/3-keto-L-gulonate kinase [Planctomycetes bacterium ADurb.Bin126]|nr:MAG: L-xylulose/3-keto-L-gulonate kinase [Planctomycetes bacterium ADurb.Bin126]HOD82673.1 FGGY-family carbohydrate kinase [Phycisphaerae bacterium]HQL73836.1 FGGY-family carbohydrate kinase [Phycisphaerae bacterium]
MPQYLMGIDNGCTVSKAALFTADGKEVAVASAKTQATSPKPDWYERDTEEVWTSTAAAVKQVIAQAGVDAKDIAAVACTGHGNGLYLVDEAGKPVRPGILSMDGRAKEYIRRWQAEGVGQKVLPMTMQSIWPAQPNALLAWLRDNEPDTFKKARWVLMCKDFARSRLTGKIQMELTDMSGTSLMNLQTRGYDQAVLEAFGIGEMMDLLPPIVRSEEVCGTVTAEAAAATGLAEGTPVAGGMFDIDACGLATGTIDDSQLCMIAGTWGNNQYISKTPVVSEDVFMTSCYAMPEYYLILEGSATSASNLEWIVNQFFQAEQATAAQRGTSVYDVCNEWVEQTKPEDAKIVFLPFLYGSNAHADAKGSLVGMAGWHTRGHVLRAVYEGVVFGHLTHVNKLMKFRPPFKRVRLVGGASRSRAWVQIFADALQAPVEIPDGTELGALGAAICAAVAAGVHPSYEAAVGAMVRFSRVQEPQSDKAALYQAKFDRYQKVVQALGGVWKDLA